MRVIVETLEGLQLLDIVYFEGYREIGLTEGYSGDPGGTPIV